MSPSGIGRYLSTFLPLLAREVRRMALAGALCFAGMMGFFPASLLAQDGAAPSFWDPNRRLTRPDVSKLPAVLFLTDDDYPPFHFTLPDGELTGFNVDLARALCAELKISCAIQTRRWESLIDSLEKGEGQAAIASLAIQGPQRDRVSFTMPYYLTPGRFVARTDRLKQEPPTPENMAGARIGAVASSAHAAWLAVYFPESRTISFETIEAARAALIGGDIDFLFADAVSSSIWLSGGGAECCAFYGGPFVNPRYFGVGVGIAVAKNDLTLRRALDYALSAIAARGIYAELFLKYFPISPF